MVEDLLDAGEIPRLDIDHIDNNTFNNDLKNLQLLCHSCNVKKGFIQATEPFERKASPEMVVGKIFEKKFRRWINGYYMENCNSKLQYDFVINSGAEEIGCSQETLKRYLGKMTSKNGFYEWEENNQGIFLVLKDEHKTNV